MAFRIQCSTSRRAHKFVCKHSTLSPKYHVLFSHFSIFTNSTKFVQSRDQETAKMNANKARLSKSILEMKFMKRTKEKVEKQQFQEEGEEYFGSEMTERMKNYSERFIIEPSYVFCEKLTDGRVSYKGMNPEIERLMELEQANERVSLEEKKKNETDISDEQMAQQLDRFKGMRNKPQSKYRYQRSDKKNKDDEPVKKKPKFLKPQD